MTNLISESFKNQDKKLVTFVTGGDPDFETSNKIIQNIVENDVDIIEIGMPFSDPMADGPTIQLSSKRALKKNITLESYIRKNHIKRLKSHLKNISCFSHQFYKNDNIIYIMVEIELPIIQDKKVYLGL